MTGTALLNVQKRMHGACSDFEVSLREWLPVRPFPGTARVRPPNLMMPRITGGGRSGFWMW